MRGALRIPEILLQVVHGGAGVGTLHDGVFLPQELAERILPIAYKKNGLIHAAFSIPYQFIW